MKKMDTRWGNIVYLNWIVPICFMMALFFLSGFNVDSKQQKIHPLYVEYLEHRSSQLLHEARLFHKMVLSNADDNSLQNQILNVQESFRRIQFILEYVDGAYIKKYINGPPLPYVEKDVPQHIVLPATGLQVLMEQCFSTHLDRTSLAYESMLLVQNVDKLMRAVRWEDLDNLDVKRAIYLDCIRIYTLLLTGFESPGSNHGIRFAKYNFEGIIHFLQIDRTPNKNKQELTATLIKSSNYLTMHSNFDSFDRAAFYIDYMKPILQKMKVWSLEDQEYTDENERYFAIRFFNQELFAADFFNTSFYAQLSPKLYQDTNIVQLGRLLFNEKKLSKDHSISCATCHQPDKAFTDGLKTNMTNIPGISGKRNTPTLLNAYLAGDFFYDVRAESLQEQMLHVVYDETEFDLTMIDIIARIEADEVYQKCFERAFPSLGTHAVNQNNITTALTAYLVSLNAFDSPFDRYMRREDTTINEKVIQGFNLFTGKAACATCHFIPTFSGLLPPLYEESESEVIGVPEFWPITSNKIDPDLGRYNNGKIIDRVDHFKNAFKTTTVRNLGQTAPYMHNGVFTNLNDLLEFYNKGGGRGIALDVDHQSLSNKPLELSPDEVDQLIQFMLALNSDLRYNTTTF